MKRSVRKGINGLYLCPPGKNKMENRLHGLHSAASRNKKKGTTDYTDYTDLKGNEKKLVVNHPGYWFNGINFILLWTRGEGKKG
jgi:hypothetical protein